MPITLESRMYRARRDDHIVASVVRNEALRLPYWLAYYRSLGFDRFLVVDNGSTDGTYELLFAQPDVTLFATKDSYRDNKFGIHWISPILDEYCHGHWVLVADADELLVWPGCDRETIKGLTAWLEGGGRGEGLFVVMIDMYSDRPFGAVGYVPGTPFQEATPFFDRWGYWIVEIKECPHHMVFGGARGRVFQAIDRHQPASSKVPLVRWPCRLGLGGGCHILKSPWLASMRGALLHFKMFDDVVERCKEEVVRGEHYEQAREYLSLGAAIDGAPGRCFYDPAVSVRYEGPAQLVELGLMNAEHPFGGFPGKEGGPAG